MPTQKHTTTVRSQRDRLSYLWLALGIVLLPFSMPNWTIPLAAWLFPIFLLRFVRTQPLLRGMLLVLLANRSLRHFAGLHNLLAAPKRLSAKALAPYQGRYPAQRIGFIRDH